MGGSNFFIYDEDEIDKMDANMDRIKSGMGGQAGENMKRASESAKGLDKSGLTPPPDMKESVKDLKRG
nr:hypothetical protein [Veillonella denticariosi]